MLSKYFNAHRFPETFSHELGSVEHEQGHHGIGKCHIERQKENLQVPVSMQLSVDLPIPHRMIGVLKCDGKQFLPH